MKFTRKELYDLVWSEPMIVICKRFGLSDTGLRKHCKSMDIPTPPVGYWAKLKYGKNAEIIPLPKEYEKKKREVDLTEIDTTNQIVEDKIDLAPVLSRQVQIELEISQGDVSVFVVPEVLYAKDAIIIDTKEKLREYFIPYYERKRKNPYKNKINETLNVNVDEKSVNRALCIFSTIIKALRFRGHNIKIETNTTYALVNDEKIELSLTEKKRVIPNTPNRATEFSGELYFNVHYGYREKTIFKSTTCTKLEDKIISIVANIEMRAEKIKEERIDAEKRRIIREEEDRQRRAFKERQDEELKEFKAMFKMAERHQRANILRDYIYAYEKFLETSERFDEEEREKLEWARKKADWLDPFKDIEDEYLKDYHKDEISQNESSWNSFSREASSYTFWSNPYRWFNKRE